MSKKAQITTQKFTKSGLLAAINSGQYTTVKDTDTPGLKFKIGKKRSVFQFEKRISGQKKAPVTFTIGAFPAISIEEARQKARILANLCEQGIDPREKREEEQIRKAEQEVPKVILGDAIVRFLEIKKELAKMTLEKYQAVIKNQIPESWKKRDMRSISAEMLVAQFHVCRETCRDRCWEFLKVYQNIWNTCSPFFKDAAGKRILPLNQSPVAEARSMLKHIRKDAPHCPVICANMLGEFVVMLERLRSGEVSMSAEKKAPPTTARKGMCDILLLSLFTAFRFTETRFLKWEYINLEHGIIRLPGDAREEKGGFDGTKNHQDHWIPLSEYPWEMLRKQYAERDPRSPYVFPSLQSPEKPMARVHEVCARIAELMESPFSPHATRRTFASIANEVGIGFLDKKRMLNHSFQGGITGKYVVPGFNPAKERGNFQKICDYILDRRAAYLGEKVLESDAVDFEDAVRKMERLALELGVDVVEVLEVVRGKKVA